MNNTKKSLKVLFIGESWHIHMILDWPPESPDNQYHLFK